MIIKATVRDNDFYYPLMNFMKNISWRISKLPSYIENLDGETQMKIIKNSQRVERLLNPNVTEEHTEEEKKLLCECVKTAFVDFVVHNYKKDADYLMKNFEVEIIDNMTDKWENGEMFYWFQHSGTVINQ